MRTPWTPGPWDVPGAVFGQFDEITGELGTAYFVRRANTGEWLSANNADARLIAKAPEMAELLGHLIEDASDVRNEPGRRGIPVMLLVRARALLEEAKGERL